MSPILVIGGKGHGDAAERKSSDNYEEEGGGGEQQISNRDEARREASKAIIRAVKMGDSGGLDKALEAHYEACERSGSEPDEGDEGL
jgi:hypothetical protein